MRKISIIIFVFINSCFFAQTPPQLINYQGVARNSAGQPIVGPIGLMFQLHSGSATGAITYSETLSAASNSLGIFNVQIGSGNPTNFALINWGASTYFLEVLLDPTGSSNYLPVGNQQLVSVPYALYAKSAGNSTNYNAGTNISITGSAPGLTLNSNPDLSLSGNTLSISGTGSTVTLPNYIGGNNITIVPPSSGNTYTINATPTATAGGGPWTNTGTNVFLVTPTDNVSIGGTSSTAKLTVTTSIATDAILAQSTGANGILAMSASSATTDAGVYATNSGVGYGVRAETISTNTAVAAMLGVNNANGNGVIGRTASSASGAAGVKGTNASAGAGVYGENIYVSGSVAAHGVKGVTGNPGAQATGVTGINTSVGAGVYGENTSTSSTGSGHGVYGKANSNAVNAYGVYGENAGTGSGVYGTTSSSAINAAGVYGKNLGTTGSGVYGQTNATAGAAAAVYGDNLGGTPGLVGQNNSGSNSPLAMGVRGLTNSSNNTAIAVSGESTGAAIGVRASIPSLTVSGSANVALQVEDGHIRSKQVNTPTVSTFSVSGGPMSLTYTTTNCTDVKGSVLAVCTTSGMINPNGTAVIRVSYYKPYMTNPTVVITPTSDYGQMNFFVSNVTTTSFNLVIRNNTTLNISGSTFAFSFNYFVIE